MSPGTTMRFFRSARGRLALTYLSIIMLMSIGFSVVFYYTSSEQLSRQLPPQSFYAEVLKPAGFNLDVDPFSFLRERIQEGRSVLLLRLILLNFFALFVGSLLSYYLARRALAPLEEVIEAQSQFVSDASHELRTPMTAIQTTNEVALRKPKLSLAEAKQIIKHNGEDIMKLKALSDGLLRLATKTVSKPIMETVSTQEVVTEAVNQIMQAALAKKVSVNDQVPDIKVSANAGSLAQVIVILLDNAIKYSPAKSTISLRGHSKGKFAYLSVKDQGIGIPAKDLPHIFKRFYRSDRSRSKENYEGYGLGLSIADKLMRQSRGEILVTSQLNKGSTFTLKLLRK